MLGGLSTLISLVVLGAALLVVHVVNLYLVVREEELGWKGRLLALLPPLTPLIAWHAGRRVAPLLWLALLAAYGVLRFATK